MQQNFQNKRAGRGRGGRGNGGNGGNANGGTAKNNRGSRGGGQGMPASTRAYILIAAPEAVYASDRDRLAACSSVVARKPNCSKALLSAALGLLGWTGSSIPPLTVRLGEIINVTPAASRPVYTVMMSSSNMTSSITCTALPPTGTVGVLTRSGKQYWVVIESAAEKANNAAQAYALTSGFTWGTATDGATVSLEELCKLDCVWHIVIPVRSVLNGNTTQEWVRAGFTEVIDSINHALSGDRSALLTLAQAFPMRQILSIPIQGLNGVQLTRTGLSCLGAWLACGIASYPDLATGGLGSQLVDADFE